MPKVTGALMRSSPLALTLREVSSASASATPLSNSLLRA